MDRLSDYLDGELAADERARLERHLARCPECAGALTELSAVVARARSLRPTGPARDLWPVIAGAIGAPGSRRIGVPPARRRVSFSVPQLAAAAVALAFGSALIGRQMRPEPAARAARPLPAADAARFAGRAAPPPGYAEELTRLQSALEDERSRLAPNTVRILDKNLAVIDRAIRESQDALALDPGNPFLKDHLERAYRGKVDYLREATALLRWGA